MKATENFKNVILDYLVKRSETDSLFVATLAKPNKNIDECIAYILNTVQKSGQNGFTDDEIFGMAVHYYDEDDIQAGAMPSNVNIVTNHRIELTEEELRKASEEAKKKAIEQAIANKTKQITAKKQKTQPKPSTEENEGAIIKQMSLF